MTRLAHACLAALLLLTACDQKSTSARVSSQRAAPSPAPWQLEAVHPKDPAHLRILVFYDMEGLFGQTNPESFIFGTSLYPKGQQQLAADINAVIAGLYQGGATEVVVLDGHGSGNPNPDVRRDLLDSRATQMSRTRDFDGYFAPPTVEKFDGVAVVGMHAKTGSHGFASHTYTFGIGIAINGQFITETELVALSWGRNGTPVIFASGDDHLATDIATTMSWLRYVTAKKAITADSAVAEPTDAAHAKLTNEAKVAVEPLRAGTMKAMKAPAPLRIGVRAVPPADLSG